MKKIIYLFMLVGLLMSCSEETKTNATPLEGNWLLIYQAGGDPSPDDEYNTDYRPYNIRYEFSGNSFVITREGVVQNTGTFEYENVGGNSFIKLHSSTYSETYEYSVSISNNSLANFNSWSVDLHFTLERIE